MTVVPLVVFLLLCTFPLVVLNFQQLKSSLIVWRRVGCSEGSFCRQSVFPVLCLLFPFFCCPELRGAFFFLFFSRPSSQSCLRSGQNPWLFGKTHDIPPLSGVWRAFFPVGLPLPALPFRFAPRFLTVPLLAPPSLAFSDCNGNAEPPPSRIPFVPSIAPPAFTLSTLLFPFELVTELVASPPSLSVHPTTLFLFSRPPFLQRGSFKNVCRRLFAHTPLTDAHNIFSRDTGGADLPSPYVVSDRQRDRS